jgi:hypothetical protein
MPIYYILIGHHLGFSLKRLTASTVMYKILENLDLIPWCCGGLTALINSLFSTYSTNVLVQLVCIVAIYWCCVNSKCSVLHFLNLLVLCQHSTSIVVLFTLKVCRI